MTEFLCVASAAGESGTKGIDCIRGHLKDDSKFTR
jgi:hypothetical protein